MNKEIIFLLAVIFGTFTVPAWAQVEAHAPMVRAMPPGQPNSVAFMILYNHAINEQVLVGARSNVATAVELHNHIMAEGMMKMRRIEQVVVPGHGQVELKPGGLHLMLIGLNQNLEVGERVTIELEFANGQRLIVAAPVRMPEGMKHEADHGKHSD